MSGMNARRVEFIVTLFEKGDRSDSNNYAGVCLLSSGSRILAGVIMK